MQIFSKNMALFLEKLSLAKHNLNVCLHKRLNTFPGEDLGKFLKVIM